MLRLRTILIAVVIFFLCFTIAGFFAVPPLVKHLLVKNLATELNRDVSINGINVNPYDLTISVSGFVVKEKGTAEIFLSFEELFANVQAISIFKSAIVVSEIRLTKPFARIIREEDGSYNFNDLIEKFTRETAASEKKPQPIQFSVNNISIINGSADFLDAPKEVFHEITDLNLTVPFVSNMKYHVETFVQPKFTALVNGDPFTVVGKTKPFTDSLETEFDIYIKDLDLADYLGYVPTRRHFNLFSGALDLVAKISYTQYAEKDPSLELTGTMTLKDINLADEKKNPLLKVTSVDLDIASVKPLEDVIHLSRINVQSPDVTIRRRKDRTIDVVTLSTLLFKAAEQSQAVQKVEQFIESKPMSILIDTWRATDGTMRLLDYTPSEPVTIEIKNAEMEARNVSLAKGSKADMQFSFLMGKAGKVSGKGTLGLEPIAANLSLDIKGLGISSFQPYFADKVRIYISSGNVNTSGTLTLEQPAGKDINAKYTGRFLVTEMNAANKDDSEELLRWKTLSLEGLDVNYNPLHFAVKGVSLSDFFAAITINTDGTLNLHQLTVAEQESTKPEEKTLSMTTEGKGGADREPALPKNVEIGGITLQGGTIKFTDKSVKPTYTANLTQIGGRVSGLSMKKDAVADVEVRGKFNDYVPLEITGKVNPWKEHFYVDLTASTKSFELSPLSPYSGKYVGYTIDKGQLSFDLKYLIVQKKLESQNRILLDQFTFGEMVESPDAIKLPVRLAVTLLKDRQGKINLDIPVTGNLDDPQFSVLGIVWKIIKNLLVKAAASPFALLGSLFGGGEDLSYIEFDYGKTNLTDGATKKLETLVKALQERPAINVEIMGHVDADKDRDGVKNLLLSRRVKAQKAKDLVKKNEAPARIDDVKVTPEEYEQYLRSAYEAEKFSKPRNIVGLTKKLPVPEMEKLILTNIVVKDEDLRNLALERATLVKDFILRSDKVTPNRLFIVQAPNLTPEKKENLKASRVDFKIK